MVGKYITDTTGTDVSGYIPTMVDHVPHNEDGVGGMHVYMPWWLDNKKLDFPRGYHIEVGGGLRPPAYGFMGGIQRYPGRGGYGAKLKDDYRRYYGATIGFSGRGEQIPNDKCYTEIDPNVVDKFGIPVLRFHWEWTDHELNQVKHMQETFRALIAEMGGTSFSPMPTKEQGYGIAAGGRIIHELGGVRMGNDPKTSVLNAQLSGARLQESLRRRRRPVRDAGGQESDVDDPRAVLAHRRLHRAAAQAGGPMSDDDRSDGGERRHPDAPLRPPRSADAPRSRCSAPCRSPAR